jgi:hypothetical protein
MLALLALWAVFLAPAVTLAFKIVCYQGYDVLVCNDGAVGGCASQASNGLYYQRDCTTADGELGCKDHGGLREISPGTGQSQEHAFNAEYAGRLPLDGFTGEGEINSTVVATLVGTCGDGRTFTCDDQRLACPSTQAEIEARCNGLGGLKSATVFTAFTPLRRR